MSDELLYRPERAAVKLDIGRSTVYEKMASGEIPSIKIGRSRRITRAALEEYVRRLSAASDTSDQPRPGAA